MSCRDFWKKAMTGGGYHERRDLTPPLLWYRVEVKLVLPEQRYGLCPSVRFGSWMVLRLGFRMTEDSVVVTSLLQLSRN